MTQTLKEREVSVMGSDEYYQKFYKDSSSLRSIVLDCLFRHLSFARNYDGKIRAITHLGYTTIHNKTGVPIPLVHKVVSRFLVDLIQIHKFLAQNPQVLASQNQHKKAVIYLHKLHRLAPIFDYKRAKENTRRLHIKLNHLYFWPQIMTQIAVIIFITDKLDKHKHPKILQTNLRSLCSCSAYAFHRTRNKIGLTPRNMKNL